MSKSRHLKKMDKTRTNITLHGEDIQLLNNIKKLILNHTTQHLPSNAELVRIALDAYVNILKSKYN